MNFDIITILGVVGSIASIVGLLLPGGGWRTKLMHIMYGLAITILAVSITVYQARVTELTRIENQAKKLLTSYPTSYDESAERGFTLSTLSFFEKYHDRLPDTYKRANTFCENVGILIPLSSGSYTERSDRRENVRDAARAMRSLLEGVASGGMN